MKKKKMRNIYLVAARIICQLIRDERSLRPLKLMVGCNMFPVPYEDSYYYGRFIEYISYCRKNNYCIHI
jgi:hypothetical protein